MLVRLAPFGVSLVALTVFGASAPTAAWQDAGRIAFATNRAQNLTRSAIYSIRPDGKGRRLVALPSPPVSFLVRSPDGRRILFSRDLAEGRGLFVASLSGEGSVRITPPDIEYPSQEAFSPDGRKVLFVGYRPCGISCVQSSLYVVNVDGSGLVSVAENVSQPSWAPDSRRLAYSSGVGGSLYVVGLGGEAPRRIGAGYHPVWAPRGNRIAYLVTKDGYGVACLVNADGSGRRCILGRSAVYLLWSPDAKRFAFKQARPEWLVVAGADGRIQHVFKDRRQGPRPVAWSPDGRRIAFIYGGSSGQSQILSRKVIGPGPSRLVTHEERGTALSDIRWRAGRISYVAYRSYNDDEIAAMDADGTGVRILTHNQFRDRQPDWSPDGRWIVFARLDGKTAGLRLIDADGIHESALTTSGLGRDTNPAWSPDGLRIAFVRTSGNSFPNELMIANRDGSGVHILSTESPYPTKISWDPEGRNIVVSARTGLYGSDLYVAAADGSRFRRLVTGRESAFAPAWSPDGARILFASGVSGNRSDLFTIRPDGTDLTRLARDVVDSSAAWAPDGSRLVFARGTPASIVTANKDGSGEVELTHDLSSNFDPAWSR